MRHVLTRLAIISALPFLPAPALAEEAAPLAERTAQSELPLDPVRAAMELPYLSLAITVAPESRSIAGEARYRVRVGEPLRQLAFDLDPRFTVSQVAVNGAPARWRNPEGLLEITPAETLAGGETVDVLIAWHGQPHVAPMPPWEGGITWAQTPAGEPWIATSIQGEGCDLFWPCIDHSAKEIDRVDLAVKVPEPLVAAGNGRFMGVERSGDWATWRWQARNPTNYGIALQIGPYELAERAYSSRFGNMIPLKFWHLPGSETGADRMLGELASYLDFFEARVGPYPFWDEKAGIAETPHLGMEHQTINAYGNAFQRDPLGYDWLLQHEFAHEWFANQMTYRGKRHMWLHEGLGTYMQPLYLEWLQGEMHYDAEMWRLRKQIASRTPLVPRGEGPPDYLDEESGWGSDIYSKGAWIAHTLRHLVGDEAFFASLTRLVYDRPDPAPGNFAPLLRDTSEFAAILSEESGQDLDWFFDAYLYQAGLPRLVATRDGQWLALAWETPSAMPFAMPVEVRIGSRSGTVAMAGGTGRAFLGEPGAHYVLDPRAHILKHEPAIAAWQKAVKAEAQ